MGPRKKEKIRHQDQGQQMKGRRNSDLDDVDLKPDRERIPSHTLEHLGVSDLPSRRRRHLLLLLLPGRRRGKIGRYRWESLGPRGRIRAPAGRVVIGLQRGRDVVGLNRGRVGRNVEERGRAAALRRAERGRVASGPRSGPGAARWSAGQFLLLLFPFVRASVHARLACAVLVLVLAIHPKREFRRLANDPPSRASRVAGACRPLLAMFSKGRRRCPARIL